MKIAKVIPLFKGEGDRSSVSNYRPISLLPTLSKIFERIICESLTEHLEKNHLLFDYQFGFRKKRNTTLAILDFVNKITDAIDNGNTAAGIFLDLSKAFDSVNHNILLDKLTYYGIRNDALKWFESYLKDRVQYVSIEDQQSETLPLTYGVPQGSILGPILFLIYFNDSQFAIEIAHLVLYADDMNLLFSHKCFKKIVPVLNNELHNLQEWFNANRLTVNLTKTKFIHFGSKQRIKHMMPLNESGTDLTFHGICISTTCVEKWQNQ